MLHKNRRHMFVEVADLHELAHKLTRIDWTGCTGWRYPSEVGDLYFLNDASSGDGAQEYAVFWRNSEGLLVEVESFTCSWMKPENFRAAVGELIASIKDGTHMVINKCCLHCKKRVESCKCPQYEEHLLQPVIETSNEHVVCAWCA